MNQQPPTHSRPAAGPPTRTALVLGGGGSAGNAWLIGLLAGLHDGGLDATPPDLTIGTSAGATAAAQLGGASPASLLGAVVAAPVPPRPPVAPGAVRRTTPSRAASHLDRLQAVIAQSSGLVDWRRRMAAVLVQDAASADPASERWRDTVAARLPDPAWPAHRLILTAVDADTGEPVLIDSTSGVDLVDAVAASTAGGFAYRVGDRRYIDGGYRANADNADLAMGYDRVLVLSPLSGRSFTPATWGTHLSAQVRALRAAGRRLRACRGLSRRLR